MDNKELNNAIQLAKSSIYDGAKYLGKWHEYDVFKPTFNDNKPRCIGFPQFILAKDGSMRWDDGEAESRALMRHFYTKRK